MTAGFLLESRKMGFIGTVIVWFIFVICAVCIPPASRSEPEYETVQLTLAPMPNALSAETETPPAETEMPAVAETAASAKSPVSAQPAAARTEPAARPSSATQPAASSSAAQPAAAAPEPARQELVKSVEELMAEAAARPKTTKDTVNWDELFADGDSVSEVSGGGTTTVNASQTAHIDSLSGRAAASGSQQSASDTDSASARRREDSSVSEGTQTTLSRIATASRYGSRSASGAVDYEVTAETTSEAVAGNSTSAESGSSAGTGTTRLRLADGSLRTLLEPETPIITISADNERYIDASREVSVSFSIQPSGAVTPGSIRVTPSSLLHQSVEDEIKAQIAKWRFQKAASSGQVSFEYNIIKR